MKASKFTDAQKAFSLKPGADGRPWRKFAATPESVRGQLEEAGGRGLLCNRAGSNEWYAFEMERGARRCAEALAPVEHFCPPAVRFQSLRKARCEVPAWNAGGRRILRMVLFRTYS